MFVLFMFFQNGMPLDGTSLLHVTSERVQSELIQLHELSEYLLGRLGDADRLFDILPLSTL